MKKIIIALILLCPLLTLAQSKTTQKFHEANEEAFVLFFYNNTLKMLNQSNDVNFEELIKDIDKMKFVRVEASEEEAKQKMKELKKGFQNERFEDLMNMRHDGMNINVYIQEDDGSTTGVVMLMNDDESVSVLDIKGKVPLNKVASLISQVQRLN